MKAIKIKTEFITLGQFIKFAGIISNGGEAKNYIISHQILVNNEPENRRGRKLYPGTIIQIAGTQYEIE